MLKLLANLMTPKLQAARCRRFKNLSAEYAMGGDRRRGGEPTERDDAAEWLQELLADGPLTAAEVERAAREAGHSFATVRRAKAAIGVVSRKSSLTAGWVWALPPEAAHAPKARTEDAHTRPSERLREQTAENAPFRSKALTSGQVSAFEGGERLRAEQPDDVGDGDFEVTKI